MTRQFPAHSLTRRQLLRGGAAATGAALLAPMFPDWILQTLEARQPAAAPADPLAQMRAQIGAIPIQTVKLGERLSMLAGPGGNVVVLTGPDGKVVVDSFVLPAWTNLRQTLDGLAERRSRPDRHALAFRSRRQQRELPQGRRRDRRAREHAKRLTRRTSLLGTHFPPAPPEALPTETFKTRTARRNGEQITLGSFRPRTPTPTSTSASRRATCFTWATCSSTACIPSSTPARGAASTA